MGVTVLEPVLSLSDAPEVDFGSFGASDILVWDGAQIVGGLLAYDDVILRDGSVAFTADQPFGGFKATGLAAVELLDTDDSHSLAIAAGSDLTANRALTISTGDSNRALTLTGDASIEGTNTGDSASVPIGYLDIDTSLAANSDSKVATQKATKAYVDAIVAANDAMVFKGAIDCSTNPDYPAADRGWTYRVSVAGKIGGSSGVDVEVGDLAMCLTDSTASGDQATVGSNWTITQTNLDGAVIGPASCTEDNIPTFDGATGKLLQDSGVAFSDLVFVADIGVSVQAYSANLDDWAGETPTDYLTTTDAGTTYQPLDATLTSIAALGTAADKLIYTTGTDTWAEAPLTSFARSILDDADEATFKATVNLEIGTDVQAYSARLADVAGLAVTDSNIIVGNGTTWVAESGATARTSLGLGTGNSPQFTRLNLGATDEARFGIKLETSLSGSSLQVGTYLAPTFSSAAVTALGSLWACTTAAASFTVTTASACRAGNATLGSGSAITSQYGFEVQALSSGAMNAAYRGATAYGSANWNLYMDGTAHNYLRADLMLGTTTFAGGTHSCVFVLGDNGGNPTVGTTQAGIFNKQVTSQGEVHVIDGGGTITQISPHAKDGPDWLYDAEDLNPVVRRTEENTVGCVHYVNETRRDRLLWLAVTGQPLPTGLAAIWEHYESFEDHNARCGHTGDRRCVIVSHEQVEAERKAQLDIQHDIYREMQAGHNRAMTAWQTDNADLPARQAEWDARPSMYKTLIKRPVGTPQPDPLTETAPETYTPTAEPEWQVRGRTILPQLLARHAARIAAAQERN